MQIARKASLGLAILGLVAGLALFPKTASAQSVNGTPPVDPKVVTGSTYTVSDTLVSTYFQNVTVNGAAVVFTGAPAGFKTTDFTATFDGPFTLSFLDPKKVDIIDYSFLPGAPAPGIYDFTILLYGIVGNGVEKIVGTDSVIDEVLPGGATATPEPSQTVALIIGALGIGGLMLLRRRKSFQA